MMLSRVFCATPPKEVPEGEGRIKAFGSLAKVSIRVLSPKILPLLRELVGSTAKTATLFPWSVKVLPNVSIKELLPTPGTPVIPKRILFVGCVKHFSIMALAFSKCAVLVLSNKVMALASIALLPSKIPWARASAESSCFLSALILEMVSEGVLLSSAKSTVHQFIRIYKDFAGLIVLTREYTIFFHLSISQKFNICLSVFP